MNFQLLLILIGCYTAIFFLLGFLMRPGVRYLRDRFQAEFGLQMNDQNIAALQPEQLSKWEFIRHREFGRTFYRWGELSYMLFHYPSIVVLSFVLRRDELLPWQMFVITGTTHVTIAYLQLHR
jgi:hypothetical protein